MRTQLAKYGVTRVQIYIKVERVGAGMNESIYSDNQSSDHFHHKSEDRSFDTMCVCIGKLDVGRVG